MNCPIPTCNHSVDVHDKHGCTMLGCACSGVPIPQAGRYTLAQVIAFRQLDITGQARIHLLETSGCNRAAIRALHLLAPSRH